MAAENEKQTGLKPCPFCGGKKIRIYAYDPFDGYQGNLTVHRVHCTMCGVQVQRDKVMDAIEAWNRRAEDGK